VRLHTDSVSLFFGLKVPVTATFKPVKPTQIIFRKIRQKPSKSTA